MKQQKQFKRYIPTLLKDELDKLSYTRKDDLYVILDLIHRKEVYYKSDYQNRYGFTEISLAQFKELIPSSDNLNIGLQFLIDNKLLLRNNYFVMGIQPKSYKIPKEYLGKTLPVAIKDKNINKRIGEQMKKHKKMKVKNLEFAKTEYFKTFKIDIDGANAAILDRATTEIKSLCYRLNLNYTDTDILDIIECRKGHAKKRLGIIVNEKGKELDNIIHRYMVYTTRINAINDGFLFFKRNDTNGRLDTNLTSLPSFLRPYLIASEKLMNVDIKNSQPYFLYTLILNKPEIEPEEMQQYAELVIGGTLYEYLAEQFKKQTGFNRERHQIKGMLFKIFFSKVNSYGEYKKFFGGLFPTIMEYINQTNFDKHNTLSIQLQTKESFTILDVIMPLLEQHNIRPYTIHDSFVCKESEAMTLKQLFIDKVTDLYGIAPALHVDYLIPTNVEEEELVTVWDDEFLEALNAAVDKAGNKESKF